MLKGSLEITRPCPSCHSECEISPNHRSCGCHRRVLIPRVTVSGGQDGGQNVGTGKSRQGRTILDREDEQSHGTEVAKNPSETMPAMRVRILDNEAQCQGAISFDRIYDLH
jgi:hypothetical protein